MTSVSQKTLEGTRRGGSWRERLILLHPRRFFIETWREIDAETAEARAQYPGGNGYDFRPLVALCLGAVCLVLIEYFGHTRHFHALVGELAAHHHDDPSGALSGFLSAIQHSDWRELAGFAWWTTWRVLGYVVIPTILIRFVWREKIRDYGLATKSVAEHAWLYLLAYLVVLVGIVFVTLLDPRFGNYYPMYHQASRSWADLLGWEILYVTQFFALEFFFRGFWLNSMRMALGSQAIFAMVVPYCMIHIGKPLPETLAAIFAGVFLGTLALKTRSIWGGFLIHAGVAVSMDASALIATRGLPGRWWPG